MAVPALPRYSSPPVLGNLPPQPCTTISFSSQSAVICTPSCSKASAMCLVSSLSCTLVLILTLLLFHYKQSHRRQTPLASTWKALVRLSLAGFPDSCGTGKAWCSQNKAPHFRVGCFKHLRKELSIETQHFYRLPWASTAAGEEVMLTSTFWMPEMPSDSAASRTIRFVIDFEPGSTTWPLRESTGATVTELTAQQAKIASESPIQLW